MRTRRVRRAIWKIEKLLIADGVSPNSDLGQKWDKFRKAFIKEYKKQWTVKKPIKKKPQLVFKANPNRINEMIKKKSEEKNKQLLLEVKPRKIPWWIRFVLFFKKLIKKIK